MQGVRQRHPAPEEESRRQQRQQRDELRHHHAGVIEPCAAQGIGFAVEKPIGGRHDGRDHQQGTQAQHHQANAQGALFRAPDRAHRPEKTPQVADTGFRPPVDGNAHGLKAPFGALLRLGQVGERTLAS